MQGLDTGLLLIVAMISVAVGYVLKGTGQKIRITWNGKGFDFTIGDVAPNPLPDELTFHEALRARKLTLNNKLPQRIADLGRVLKTEQMVLGVHPSQEWVVQQLTGYSSGCYHGLPIMIWHTQCVDVVNRQDCRLVDAQPWGYDKRQGNGRFPE